MSMEKYNKEADQEPYAEIRGGVLGNQESGKF